MINVLVERMPHAEGLALPTYQTPGSAAMDLMAAVETDLVIPSGARILVPTGLKVAIPECYEIQLRPRSGLALKSGISLPNTPATIDSDYRGELKVILINFGQNDFIVTRGMRICQALVARVEQMSLKEVNCLPTTERGEGGFGHTGV
jgi:dUTP pyrophosphatase